MNCRADSRARIRPDGRPMIGDQYAYRVVWEEEHGPLPEGVVLHHTCPNIWCVVHVVPVQSQSEHLKLHGIGGDWGQALKTHCPQGHEYTPENTYTHHGHRHCLTCRRAAKARYRARLKASRETR